MRVPGAGGGGDPGNPVVGRSSELAALDAYFGADGSGTVVLSGEPGIGKTTLWQAAIDVARSRKLRVLSARASDSEAQLSFAALTDLLHGVDRDELADLPAPQLHALEIALLRAEATGAPPEPRAIALGLLNALRSLAVRTPLLVAIDDVQWLDPSSGEALAFGARRLEGNGIRFLLARRSDTSSALEIALEQRMVSRLEIGPLSSGATRRILYEQLGLVLPRRLLRRIVDSARGNPLFALELGRTLVAQGLPQIGDEIPLPGAIEEVFGTRVLGLTGPVRRLLLAVALTADVRASQLAAIADAAVIDDALDSGLLLVVRDRIRVSHPLVAATVKRHARTAERRELHLELAQIVEDDGLRARHLALATDRPDAVLADTVAGAAARAAAVLQPRTRSSWRSTLFA